jgi:long-chain acyl-CoA synthetase
MIFVVMPLTDAFIRNCKGEISAFRPSIMVGVPAVCDSIRRGIVTKVNPGSPITKAIFNTRRFADDFVLSKMRAATEGRLRVGCLSCDIQEILTTALVTAIQA